MDNSNQQNKNRYPGIRSFETSDQHLFFGRTAEIQHLYHLVSVENLSILFAKSGMGKTSLIKAGITPLLTKNNYFPIFIRFQDTSLSPLAHIEQILKNHLDSNKLRQFSIAENLLWEWMKAVELTSNTIPVLIFDQFEEFFSHPQTDRKEFTQQLAKLINHYIPNEQQVAFRKIPRKARTAEQLAWYKQPNLRILLSIRSDRLSQLDEMTVDIPSILHNRFHLKSLNSTQAEAAIIQPALLTGTNYLTSPFHYTAATITHIIEQLSDEKQGHIESFQLQLLCSTIEEKVKNKQSEGGKEIHVTPNYLKTQPMDTIKQGIQNILTNYYESKLREFPKKLQLSLRTFLEEGLIEINVNDPTHGKRVNVAEARVQNKYGIAERILQKLLHTRLIRAENTHLGRVYEISHDTLVMPILKSYQNRKATEEKKRWLKNIGKGVGMFMMVVAILFVAVLLYADNQKKVATQIKREKDKKQKLIDAFYFYNNKLALSNKNGKFGFVDKKGNIVINHNYTQAEQFDASGYAKVELWGYPYIVDTIGKEYQIAYSFEEINEQTQALDLRKIAQMDTSFDLSPYTKLKIIYVKAGQTNWLFSQINALQNLEILFLKDCQIGTLPSKIGQLTKLTKLNLVNNQLTELPDELFNLNQLKELDIAYNQLTTLTDNFAKLDQLTSVNVKGNKLVALPNNFSNLNELTKLDVSKNQLYKLPDNFGQLKNLTTINVRDNQLVDLPIGFEQLNKLTSVNLAYNQIKRLPANFNTLNKLTTLNLINNQLIDLPPDFGKLKKLEELYLGSNQLTQLPPDFNQLHNLTKLALSNNKLTALPPNFGQLKALTTLEASNNEITKLADDFGELSNLVTLNLSNNALHKLPDNIGKLNKLTDIYLNFNNLKKIPNSIKQLKSLEKLFLLENKLIELPHTLSQLSALIKLDVYGNQLTNLPNNFGQLKQLQKLDISRNELTALPNDFSNLSNLKELYAANNKLVNLPSNFANLHQLNYLNLSGNELYKLPSSIVNLPNLTKLYLANIQLNALPNNFNRLNKLTVLNLGENKLTQIPNSIVKLKELTQLDLTGNNLVKLPKEITKLNKLVRLNIADNQLTTLPTKIGNLTHLTYLSLANNKLVEIPDEISKLTKLLTLNLADNQLNKLPENIVNLNNLSRLSLTNNPLKEQAIMQLKTMLPDCYIIF